MKIKTYLSPPCMSKKELELLVDAFNSNWIAPLGPNVDAFEKEMSEYLGEDIYSCALSSGTAAIHLALIVSGVRPGDKVLCPSLTFSASANAICYVNAKPVFIDVHSDNWTVNESLLEEAIKIHKPKALMTVDLYGQSCDYDIIYQICKKYGVLVIEDAAEAAGSEYKGRKLGSFGDLGIISFNGNKIITTSGGGMLFSKNKDYITRAKFLASQAKEPKIYYEHNEIGYNYRLSNLLAAIGRGQLSNLDNFVKKRRNIYKYYFDSLSQIEGLIFMKEKDHTKSNRWLTTLTLDNKKIDVSPFQIIDALDKENIESRPVWKPMHLQSVFKDFDYIHCDEDVSYKLFQQGICLPSGSNLSKSIQDKIIEIIYNSIAQ
tara:strand:+ start:6025 stop:7149 length:1125 start_codon:yes stop_codon:yes gene_type:complete